VEEAPWSGAETTEAVAVAEVEKEVEREKVAPGRANGADSSGGGAWVTGDEGGEGENEPGREKETEREKNPEESVGRGEIMVEYWIWSWILV
jgi:hypothetical protein